MRPLVVDILLLFGVELKDVLVIALTWALRLNGLRALHPAVFSVLAAIYIHFQQVLLLLGPLLLQIHDIVSGMGKICAFNFLRAAQTEYV